MQQAPYTADLQWNRVSSLEPSGPKAETLPLGHRGPEPAEEAPEENHQEENLHFDNNSFRHQGQEIRRNLSIIINKFE
ncbi:hypothetical protein AVEN_68951-1 [Araneus ventricosus]|uniref:Uncharacterized protein n=1 Tax=Araneus ventricosus TaxID=182803 RepID=A0A4Y2HID7_ARAVE|nr:hypothetical protein AVEN_68951-1 [Araneus ventricosus]